MLSSQASPGLMGLPGAAMAEMGQTIQSEGLRWLKTEIETERATELAHNTNQFESTIAQTQENVQTQTVDSWGKDGYSTATQRRQLIQDQLLKQAARQSQSISNSTVRRNFMSAARKRVSGVMPGISTTLRGKHSDYAQMQVANGYDNDVKALARTPNGGALRANMTAEIFARLDEQARLGNLKPSYVAKQKREMLSDVAEMNFSAELTQPGKTSADMMVLMRALERGEYDNLTQDGLRRARASADKAFTRLQKAEETSAFTAGVRDEKAKKRENEATYRGFYDQITAAQQKASKGDDAAMRAAREAIDNISSRDLDPADREKLIKRLDGRDEVRNPELVSQFRNDILDAVDEGDVDYIEQQIEQSYGRLAIGGKAVGELRSLIDKRRRKTPGYEEEKQYQALLKTALSPVGGINYVLKGATPDKNIPEAQALNFYQRRINEGMRPQRAYTEALALYADDTNRLIKGELQQLPDVALKAFGFTNAAQVDENGVRAITSATVQAAKEAWNNYALGKMPTIVGARDFRVGPGDQQSAEQLRKLQYSGPSGERITGKQRMTVRHLYEMENIISLIESVVSKRPAPEPTGSKKKAVNAEDAAKRGQN